MGISRNRTGKVAMMNTTRAMRSCMMAQTGLTTPITYGARPRAAM